MAPSRAPARQILLLTHDLTHLHIKPSSSSSRRTYATVSPKYISPSSQSQQKQKGKPAPISSTPPPPPQTKHLLHVQLHNPPSQLQIAPRIPTPTLLPTYVRLHSWPSLEPTSFIAYNSQNLSAPLRRDILHRAVIYEGDNKRQGTSATKHRTQVHGSSKKVRPQKGTGRARLSDAKSPSIVGGGVAHGPRTDRDFRTDLQKKVYALAFRTALSYRFSKDELMVVEGQFTMERGQTGAFLDAVFRSNGMGQGFGGVLVVVSAGDETGVGGRLGMDGRMGRKRDVTAGVGPKQKWFREAIGTVPEHARVKDVEDVDVKDLLGSGRVWIERAALNSLLRKWGVGMELNLEKLKGNLEVEAEQESMVNEQSTVDHELTQVRNKAEELGA